MTEDEQKKIFSKNLNYYISVNNKQQKEVAKDLGISITTFNTWCVGKIMPRMSKVQQIADYFHIGKSDLLDDKSQQEQGYYLNEKTREIAQEIFENPNLRSLFDVARDITPEDLKAHIEFMQRLKKRERGDSEEGC